MIQRGMALVQVLLISILLVILLISAQKIAREQIRLANAVKVHSELSLQLQSVEAELLYVLMTNEWSDLIKPSGQYRQFNFFGLPFEFAGAEVKIQDQAGLLSVNTPDRTSFSALTLRLVGDSQIGIVLADELADWRDPDNERKQFGAEQPDYPTVKVRNYGLQTLDEIKFLKSITPELYQKVRPFFSVFRQSTNMMNMPADLIYTQVSAVQAEQIIKKREQGSLNDGVLMSLGIDMSDDSVALRYGRTLQITFTVASSDVRLTRSFIMMIDPTQIIPFELLEYRMRDTEMEYIDVTR